VDVCQPQLQPADNIHHRILLTLQLTILHRKLHGGSNKEIFLRKHIFFCSYCRFYTASTEMFLRHSSKEIIWDVRLLSRKPCLAFLGTDGPQSGSSNLSEELIPFCPYDESNRFIRIAPTYRAHGFISQKREIFTTMLVVVARHWLKWKDVVQIEIKIKVGWGCMEWIHLAQYGDRTR
jgi:hypothetical protein